MKEDIIDKNTMKLNKKILIDMDDTMFHFKKKWHEVKASDGLEFPQSKIGFFEELEPIENAIEVYNWLDEHFDVWVVTAPSIPNKHCYSEKAISIEKHLGPERCHKLIISPDKSMVYGDYLIDDTITKGQLKFKGRLLRYGTEFKNWLEIKEFFNKILLDKVDIDLDIYRKDNSKVFTGKLLAQEILREIDIVSAFQRDRVILNVPESTFSINPSFLEELFRIPIKALGREAFLDKLVINNLSKADVESNLNEAMHRVEREAVAEASRPKKNTNSLIQRLIKILN